LTSSSPLRAVLLDHLGERRCDLSQIEILVLDEADQMLLDMGFIAPIRQIVKHLPKKRQNLFFSATMPQDIGKLAGDLLNDPVKVSVAPQATTAERVNQQVMFIEAGRKRGLLTATVLQAELSRVLVFTRTKRGANKVARILEGGGVAASAIHGNKSQAQRERALAEFKAGKVRALVATDIAARRHRRFGISDARRAERNCRMRLSNTSTASAGRPARARMDSSCGVLRRGRDLAAAGRRTRDASENPQR